MSLLVCKQCTNLNLDLVEYLGYIRSHLELVKKILHPRPIQECHFQHCGCCADRTLGNHFTSNDATKATVKQISEQLLCLQT